MPWSVQFHPEMVPEFEVLPEDVRKAILKRVVVLQEFGPNLGRPLVDSLNGSKIRNLKELRCDADGRVWRVALAFDKQRVGVLLVAADKQGISQERFYNTLIATAEDRWERWT